MATKFGRIDYSEGSFEEQTFHKNQTVTSASEGVHLVTALKDQTTDPDGSLTVSASHWAFTHTMFYTSGSSKVNTDEQDKFNNIYSHFNQYNDLKPFYINKFYDSASVIYIPQQTFGNGIKSGSFQLTARSGSSSNTTKEIIIKDDGNGNLYSTNAHHSQSVDTALSSSDNYVGNIFYNLGVVTLTETASWSGSVNYTDIGRIDSTTEQTYNFWDLKFNSILPIYTSEYTLQLKSGDFNSTMNLSAFSTGSGKLKSNLTESNWSPYFNQIQLYGYRNEEPLIIANLPRAVKTRDDVDIIITFRMDH